MDKKAIIILVKQYLNLLSKEGIMIDKAFLYGSYAKDIATAKSDIDLLLVSNNFDDSNDMLVGKIWYLTKKISSKIEPYIISSLRFNSDETSPLIQIVKNEGLEIV